jgi:hypothetical protein
MAHLTKVAMEAECFDFLGTLSLNSYCLMRSDAITMMILLLMSEQTPNFLGY